MRKIILWLFAIALISRAIVAIIQIAYGISSELNYETYIYGYFNPGLEIYHDFYGYYVTQLIDLSKGMMPYKDFAYSYPPLFLYSLYPFFKLGGEYAASIPILLADAATSPLIYVIVRRFAGERISLAAGISYAISPFFLIYEGYLWFSSQPMTFFLLLAIYLLFNNKLFYSSAVLAIAILFKQEILFILPFYFMWCLKYYKRSDIEKGIIIIVATLGIVSLPFLLATPGGYVTSVSYATLDHSYIPPLSSVAISGNSTQTASSIGTQSLTCSLVSNTWRSSVCNYGSLTYTDFKSQLSWTVIFSWPFLNIISPFLALPLIGVSLYYTYVLRRADKSFTILSGLILLVFITIFDIEIHSIFRYYFIPVYALLLIATTDRYSLGISIGAPLVSLVLPSGAVQLLPPLIGMLAILFRDYWKSLPNNSIFLQDQLRSPSLASVANSIQKDAIHTTNQMDLISIWFLIFIHPY
ncbi:MAG TPA: glycosyltransferase family 39 protein [Nitrososphaerales archaeon]|nr:glycosyltransferase family 39 protein [Nitrososphaerales archaeon]